ncbi:MAG TPA: OFA family MFS transporter [Candidatus Baltobacteraceae bacterium]|nr:OFA family MFS transporter [Candidatus Baltobacteraceae bacterium]
MSFLDRSHTIAKPGFSRWLVPPAALCIHLCIGQAYALSVFNKPMSQLIGISAPAPGDWSIPAIGWIFSIAIVFLGLSAAFAGKWVEDAGPRKAMFAAALFFSGGLIISAAGVAAHQLWLVYLGYGVIGGIGLGIGYISPVSTLVKWFPDRPGLATGTAIMGFGGGALIGAPLAVDLMKMYATPSSTGVAPTLLTMGLIYLCFMLIGAFIVRVPASDWLPAGYVAPTQSTGLVTAENVLVGQAVKTPQFYLLWMVLFLNVTAGIGVLGQASLMIQEMFPAKFPHDTAAATQASAAAAAGFVGLLSVFNMGGRIFWASMSDFIGRRMTYVIFFVLGAFLYGCIPALGRAENLPLFIICYLIILSMYGGGFATIPAYLRDLYGHINVGAIHGRILTAWSAAGIAGPVLVNYIREYQINHGVAKADAYSVTMYVMAVLLVIGLVCNLLVRPVHERHHYKEDEVLVGGVA